MTDKLTKEARILALKELSPSGWSEVENRDAIEKEYRFKNFAEAFGWMTSAAIHAEKMNHHPEWSNVYNKVSVTLTSHNVSGLSARDIKLARILDALPQRT